MGLTHVAVELSQIIRRTNGQYITAQNSSLTQGAMDSMAPASELRKSESNRLEKDFMNLRAAKFQEYEHGIAQVSFMGEVTWTRYHLRT